MERETRQVTETRDRVARVAVTPLRLKTFGEGPAAGVGGGGGGGGGGGWVVTGREGGRKLRLIRGAVA